MRGPVSVPSPTLVAALAWVYDETGVARREIAERNRAPRVANARLLAVWGARTVGRDTFARISRALGHERRFAVAAYDRANRLIIADPAFRDLAARLWAHLALGDETRAAVA